MEPTAAASVGVAIPARMEPSTARISTAGRISTRSTWLPRPSTTSSTPTRAGHDLGLVAATHSIQTM